MKRQRHAFIVPASVLLMLSQQSAYPAQQSFEAATIKQQQPQTLRIVGGSCHGVDSTYPPNAAIVPPLGRCLITFSLKSLVAIAYATAAPAGRVSQITGGPDWVDSDFWLVEAKAEDAATSKEADLKQMLQALLVDRFKLQVHQEDKEVSGFALVVAKGGLKIPEDHGEKTNEPVMSAGPAGLVYRKAPLSMFANFLSGSAGAPVIDKTGLTGLFSFSFKPPRPQLATDPTNSEPAAPSIFTAIQEDLGLRLEPVKIPAEFIVIDHAERPTPN